MSEDLVDKEVTRVVYQIMQIPINEVAVELVELREAHEVMKGRANKLEVEILRLTTDYAKQLKGFWDGICGECTTQKAQREKVEAALVDERKAHAETKARLEKVEAACLHMRAALEETGIGCCPGEHDGMGHTKECVVTQALSSGCGLSLLDELARLRDENEKLLTPEKP